MRRVVVGIGGGRLLLRDVQSRFGFNWLDWKAPRYRRQNRHRQSVYQLVNVSGSRGRVGEGHFILVL